MSVVHLVPIAYPPLATGTPTTSRADIHKSSRFANRATGSPYAFFFADLDVGVSGVDTLYVVDDNVPAGTGGIYKYSFVSPNWVQTGGLAGLAADNYRGLTGIVSGTTVTLFATRKGSELVSLVDTAGYNAPFSATTPTLLATAGTNMAFRGVALAPNPPDIAPTVTSTVPTNTAINVAIDATITVNFSEPVTASGTWATLSCGGSSCSCHAGWQWFKLHHHPGLSLYAIRSQLHGNRRGSPDNRSGWLYEPSWQLITCLGFWYSSRPSSNRQQHSTCRYRN